MASFYKVLSWTLVITALNCIASTQSNEDDELPKIGIVGGGIGGTTAAYYARQLFGDDVIIDVFEQDRVGGRMASINIDGLEYEAGASVMHPLNQYMVNFTKLLGLETLEGISDTLGFYGNKGMLLETSPWYLVSFAKMVWRYGYDIVKIKGWVTDVISKYFERIYPLQNAGIAFTTVEDLLRAMDESFVRYTQITVRELFQEQGFSDIFINEIVRAAMRANYGQSLDMPGFVGAVSMAGVQPGMFSVKGGNKLIPEKLLKKSKANLIHGKVTNVLLQKMGESVSYELTYKLPDAKDGDDKAREYDIVIMATPLPTGQTDIKFEEFAQSLRFPDMKLHQTIALFIQGFPNISYFGYEKMEHFPNEILTVDDEVLFSSIGRKHPVTSKKHLRKQSDSEEEIYRVFLNKVPTEQEVRLLFSGRKDLRLINWNAYPQYNTKMELPPFVLYDKLYYVNAIENAASAMEMSAVAARNVALLAYNHWYGHLDKIDEVILDDGSEKKEEL